METMYDTLLQLPLFQGLSRNELTAILGKIKLHFNKRKAESIIVEKDTPCKELHFVINGEVVLTTTPPSRTFSVHEMIPAPLLIEPQALFGMRTAYQSTYSARSEVHVMSISKEEVMSFLFKNDIFRLNYINIITNRAQTLHARFWDTQCGDAEERIKRFICSRMERPYGEKTIRIKMEVLGDIINDTRYNVSKILNSLQDKGVVQLHRGEIHIPAIERL